MPKLTDIRFVITPDRLAHITLLDSGRSLVVQAPFLRSLLELHPRTVLGSTTIDHVQLRMLGVIPVKNSKEVSSHDLNSSIIVAV